VGVGVAGVPRQPFRHCVEQGCGGGLVRQGAVWTLVVVVVDEGVEQGLQLSNAGGLGVLGAEPFLEGESPRVSWRLDYLEPAPVGTGVSG